MLSKNRLTPLTFFINTYATEKLGWSRQTTEGTLNSVIDRFKATFEGGVSTTPLITEFFPRVETKIKVVLFTVQ